MLLFPGITVCFVIAAAGLAAILFQLVFEFTDGTIGSGRALRLIESHLVALADQDLQASGDPACEVESRVNDSPARLDSPAQTRSLHSGSIGPRPRKSG